MLSCSHLYSQCLEECLLYNGCSINMGQWMDKYRFIMYKIFKNICISLNTIAWELGGVLFFTAESLEAKKLSDFSKVPQSSDTLSTEIHLLYLGRMDQEWKQVTDTNHIIIVHQDFIPKTAALYISRALKTQARPMVVSVKSSSFQGIPCVYVHLPKPITCV